jgi:GNAT superfamily N-acetyltransferase
LSFSKEDALAGFGRVVTDHAVFAYVMDVFILEEHRGLGKRLMEHMMDFPSLKAIKMLQLITDDAHGLYAKYGFRKLAAPEKHMEKIDKRYC